MQRPASGRRHRKAAPAAATQGERTQQLQLTQLCSSLLPFALLCFSRLASKRRRCFVITRESMATKVLASRAHFQHSSLPQLSFVGLRLAQLGRESRAEEAARDRPLSKLQTGRSNRPASFGSAAKAANRQWRSSWRRRRKKKKNGALGSSRPKSLSLSLSHSFASGCSHT